MDNASLRARVFVSNWTCIPHDFVPLLLNTQVHSRDVVLRALVGLSAIALVGSGLFAMLAPESFFNMVAM